METQGTQRRRPQNLIDSGALLWLRGLDLNQRPLGYENGCSLLYWSLLFLTPRLVCVLTGPSSVLFAMFRPDLLDGCWMISPFAYIACVA